MGSSECWQNLQFWVEYSECGGIVASCQTSGPLWHAWTPRSNSEVFKFRHRLAAYCSYSKEASPGHISLLSIFLLAELRCSGFKEIARNLPNTAFNSSWEISLPPRLFCLCWPCSQRSHVPFVTKLRKYWSLIRTGLFYRRWISHFQKTRFGTKGINLTSPSFIWMASFWWCIE